MAGEVAEALAHRPLLVVTAGAVYGHLRALVGVAELVHEDHVSVLAVMDTQAVAHVQGVVGGREERVVIADAVDVDRHRARGRAELKPKRTKSRCTRVTAA